MPSQSKSAAIIGRLYANGGKVQYDIFLLPSYAEALPTVLIEAQACGMLILSTNVGAVEEIIKSGILVEPGDIDSLFLGLKQLIKSSNQWETMSMKGREAVENKFDIDDQISELLKLYNELLTTRGQYA